MCVAALVQRTGQWIESLHIIHYLALSDRRETMRNREILVSSQIGFRPENPRKRRKTTRIIRMGNRAFPKFQLDLSSLFSLRLPPLAFPLLEKEARIQLRGFLRTSRFFYSFASVCTGNMFLETLCCKNCHNIFAFISRDCSCSER